MQSVRRSWEVRAGMIPGEAMEEYTRQFQLLTAEWETKDGLELLLKREAEAGAYARMLQILCSNGRTCNWTELTFIWYQR
jgi:hypothetical protein